MTGKNKRFATDSEFVERQREMEAKRAELHAQLKAQEKPLVDELRSLGFPVNSAAGLANLNSYAGAIPVLIRHFQRPYHPNIRQVIGVLLAIPESVSEWDTLVDLYCKETEPAAKMGLANALSRAVDSAHLDCLIELLRDRRHGESRGILLAPLRRRRKNAKVAAVLAELTRDPELATEIASWPAPKT